jgi:hypothetical protein
MGSGRNENVIMSQNRWYNKWANIKWLCHISELSLQFTMWSSTQHPSKRIMTKLHITFHLGNLSWFKLDDHCCPPVLVFSFSNCNFIAYLDEHEGKGGCVIDGRLNQYGIWFEMLSLGASANFLRVKLKLISFCWNWHKNWIMELRLLDLKL